MTDAAALAKVHAFECLCTPHVADSECVALRRALAPASEAGDLAKVRGVVEQIIAEAVVTAPGAISRIADLLATERAAVEAAALERAAMAMCEECAGKWGAIFHSAPVYDAEIGRWLHITVEPGGEPGRCNAEKIRALIAPERTGGPAC